MKHRLQATAEHHRNRSMETGADHEAVTDADSEISKQFEQTRALHEKLAGYVHEVHEMVCIPRCFYCFVASSLSTMPAFQTD